MDFQALFVVLWISWFSSREARIFRSSCRRDTLMKSTDRDKKLTGTAQDIISENRVAGARYCVRLCTKELSCVSVNFKVTRSSEQEINCQLLRITKSEGEGTLTGASGWRHYEPVFQVNFLFICIRYQPGIMNDDFANFRTKHVSFSFRARCKTLVFLNSFDWHLVLYSFKLSFLLIHQSFFIAEFFFFCQLIFSLMLDLSNPGHQSYASFLISFFIIHTLCASICFELICF